MRFKSAPIGFPRLAHIVAFLREESRDIEEILRLMGAEYGSSRSETRVGLEVVLDSAMAYITGIEDEDCRVFLITLDSKGRSKGLEPSLEKLDDYRKLVRKLETLMPGAPISSFAIRTGLSRNFGEAQQLLKEYLSLAERSVRSVGLVRSCLLAALEDGNSSSQTLKREFVVIPFDYEPGEATKAIWRLYGELAILASCAGRLSRLRRDHDIILRQIDASDKSTQMRINEIFASIRRSPDMAKPEMLEEVLREVTTLFSSLSILVSSMRRNYVKAKSLLRRATSLFNSWNERPLEDYQTNSSFELDSYRSLIAPFEDFIDRVDALRMQLNTVLDAVRTYLGIQEQKLSVEEQASSKDLLARLVSLQEVLHKLEILIVAFYITEMGRLVFEAVAHEKAGILTVAFIPVALVTSIIIRKMLHRH